ncbi:MAG: hypothetical protein AB7H86_07850 [Blastocatellales bacterium]
MNPGQIWSELLASNRLLAISGAGYVALFAVLAVVAQFDDTTVLGINRWIKPMKFAISIAIFQWTMAWLMRSLEGANNGIRVISWVIFAAMLAEIVPIVGQAARGRLSHFNVSTAFDGAVFAMMGMMIGISTLATIYALVLFFTNPGRIPPAYLWGIRIGLLLFIVFSVEGGLMASRLAHTVGAPDGGPGLPFFNWSTRGGDLRIAHFVGIHALQAILLVGFLLGRLGDRMTPVNAVWLTVVFGVVYAAVTSWLFLQALAGRPLLTLK